MTSNVLKSTPFPIECHKYLKKLKKTIYFIEQPPAASPSTDSNNVNKYSNTVLTPELTPTDMHHSGEDIDLTQPRNDDNVIRRIPQDGLSEEDHVGGIASNVDYALSSR